MTKDYFWLHLRELPYFRALLRAVEAKFYEHIELPSPILDIGCGDGHFAGIAFDNKIQVGIDADFNSLKEAEKRASYHGLVQSEAGKLPFEDNFFECAVSNSVLEHISDVESVLLEISRVVKSGAPFIFCVPNNNFTSELSISRFFESGGFHYFAEKYKRFFNYISRHVHCDDPVKWKERLEKAGFELEEYFHYFSPRALKVMEWGHYFGLPCLIIHFFTGKWILVPYKWNFYLTEKLVRPYYEEPVDREEGVYTFYKARKIQL